SSGSAFMVCLYKLYRLDSKIRWGITPTSLWPEASSACRIARTPSSIIPAGPMTSAPASACRTAISLSVAHVPLMSMLPSGLARVHEPLSVRSEEHTSELQSRGHLVCRLLLEKKKKKTNKYTQAL